MRLNESLFNKSIQEFIKINDSRLLCFFGFSFSLLIFIFTAEYSSWLPLYGNLCCQLVAQPVCMTQTMMAGYLSQKVCCVWTAVIIMSSITCFWFCIMCLLYFFLFWSFSAKCGGAHPLLQSLLCAECWIFVLLFHSRRN